MEHRLIVSKPRADACIAETSCITEDFFRMRDFINKETIKNGYGLIISNPIFVLKYNSGKEVHRYIISNLIKTYYGYDIISPIAEWDDYLEQITIYDSKDIDFFNENFFIKK